MNVKAQRQELRLAGFDPDRMAGLLSATRLEHYILAPGACDVDHQHWSCGDVSVDTGRYSFPVRILGEFPRDRVSIGYMRELSEPSWVNGYVVDQSTLELYPAGCELNYRGARRGRWVAIEVLETRLQEAAIRHLGRELHLPWREVVSFPLPTGLRRELDWRLRILTSAEFVQTPAVEGFLAVLCMVLAHLHPDQAEGLMHRASRRLNLLERADSHLRSRIRQGRGARGLAKDLHVSERTLQRHFCQAYGVSPNEWARCLALHGVRHRLRLAKRNGLTVEEVARAAGFRHLGRFSGYYRDLFGELPSVTLGSNGMG